MANSVIRRNWRKAPRGQQCATPTGISPSVLVLFDSNFRNDDGFCIGVTSIVQCDKTYASHDSITIWRQKRWSICVTVNGNMFRDKLNLPNIAEFHWEVYASHALCHP